MTNKSNYLKGCVFSLLLISSACNKHPEQIEPKINYTIQDRYLQTLPSPFSPLSEEEKKSDWGREYQIGLHFAHRLDLYQAMTAFKRAEILCPDTEPKRKTEIDYFIFLCYYLGQKYEDALDTFDHSSLKRLDGSFPAAKDLVLMLYDCYFQLKQYDQANNTLKIIQDLYPEEAEKLTLSAALQAGNIPRLEELSAAYPSQTYLKEILSGYNLEKKSVKTAKALNALCPGAGYLYLGQKQSALTAFLLNGLFIGATYYFFDKGNYAAGAIFGSFEMGWYFGGITGAAEEAKFYNERIYEKHASPVMNKKGLFPVFMLKYGF